MKIRRSNRAQESRNHFKSKHGDGRYACGSLLGPAGIRRSSTDELLPIPDHA